MNRIITVTGIEPAPLSLRWPLGIDLDLRVTMRRQNGSPIDPTLAQFVLLPRSQGGVYPYDMTAADVSQGIASVSVPGTSLTDRSGYGIELYARAPNAGDPAKPVSLAARGTLRTEGSAYSSSGPMNMINIPVVTGPPGAAGAQGPVGPGGSPGAAGQRGSMWFTGSGAPGVISGSQTGDMYLDENNGDVYRYANGVWTRGTF
jgi:hypothetical protein